MPDDDPPLDPVTVEARAMPLIETRLGPQDWSGSVAPPDRPQIVVGGPGTGKTHFLVARVNAAIADAHIAPEAILALGFSRSGVNDLRRRLVDMIGPFAQRIHVATYHSLAMRIVEANAASLGWERTPSVLTAAEQEKVVADLLASETPSAWPPGHRTLLDSPMMASEVTDFILRCHEQLITPEDLTTMSDPRLIAMAGFFDRYNAYLTAQHRTDYGRILTEAVAALGAIPEIADPYDLIVADEYQDSSHAHAEMLFRLAAPGSSLTVAADPYQSIYSFRGTNINNVFTFPQDTEERLGTEAERIVLTTSFRVPSEILDAAVRVTARELPGGAGRVHSTRTGGSVAAHTFTTIHDEADWIASDIERVHLLDGVPLERVAVFTRTKSDFGSELATALERRSLPHSFTESRLTDEPVVRLVHDLVLATGTDEGAGLAIERVLLSPFFAVPYGTVNHLARLAADGATWSALIASRVPQGQRLATLIDDASWACDVPAPVGLWHVWSTLPQLVPVALDADHLADRRAWAAFDQVLTRLVERSPGATLTDHGTLVAGTDFEADPLFSFRSADDGGVTIATLHRAKGTDFDVVYIANAVEGDLPDLRSRDSLLGVRLLNPHLPARTSDYVAFRLDEERRLAYTAMTRATSRVVWTATSNDAVPNGPQPSRFLPLVASITPPHRNTEPLTPRSFEAALRLTAKDPEAPAIQRLAAIDVLAGGTHVGLSDPMTRYGALESGPHRHIVPDQLRLSPSQATAYATCPRQYAIGRHLLSRSETSDHMKFGTLIHKVIEVAERQAVEDDRQRSTRREAQACLDDLWADAGFDDDAVGRSWRERAETTLDNLYERWPTSGVPVAFERELPYTVAGVPWTGRADRIEQRGEELFVVDYKTSGSAVRVADAAVSLQLGYYVLAARDDASLVSKGSIVGAEFWYPRIDPNKTSIVTRSLEPSQLDGVTAELEAITKAIAAERFDPVVGKHCDRCDVALVCPAQPQGREAFAQ